MDNTTNAETGREPALHDPGSDAPDGTGGSRGRRIAFRVLAVIFSLFLLATAFFGLLEVVLMWLPGETLMSMLPDTTTETLTHRTHLFMIGIVSWAMVLAVVVQVRKPARRAAPMLLAVVVALGAAVMFTVIRPLGEWLIKDVTLVVPLLLLAWLHPRARELVRRPTFDRDMAWLAALAAAPWTVYFVDHLTLQLTSPATGPHAEPVHWATGAMLALVIVAASFIGASDHVGWRLPAWIAALATIVFGVHSLVFPGLASALATVWAVLSVVWGLGFAVALVRRSRAPRVKA